MISVFRPEEAPISASGTKNKPMESNKGATSNATNSSKGDFLDGSGSNGSQSSYSSEYVNGSADHRGASSKESGSASAAQKHKESIGQFHVFVTICPADCESASHVQRKRDLEKQMVQTVEIAAVEL